MAPPFLRKDMITSTSNQKIKRIIQLQKKSKARREEGVFIAEGPRMVLETPPNLLRELYVAESYESQWQEMLVETMELPDDDVADVDPIDWIVAMDSLASFNDITEVVSDHVMQAMSDTKTPQGILAVIEQPQHSLDEILEKTPAHLLLVEAIQDPGNLGTMFRTGEGAGVTGVILHPKTVDLFSPKAVRSTMGSLYRVPFYVAEDWDATIDSVQQAGVSLYAAHLQGEAMYDKFDYTKACGFFIGNEGNGLTEETAQKADSYLRIPMEGQLESLNAAMAAGILMYEVSRQRRG